MDVEGEAVSYIAETLDDSVIPLDEVMSEITHAPTPVKRYLKQRCRNLKQLEEFLRSHEDHFVVENGRVALYDPVLETGSEKAVSYFEEELNLYEDPPHYMNFRGHIGQAEEEVIDFINCFYPEEEFKEFLLAHPDIFVVFENDTVFLIENEAVDYFEECLENNKEGYYYMNLRGCIGQAPEHVIRFINDYYPEEKFLEFLENNPDVFYIDEGHVFLKEEES